MRKTCRRVVVTGLGAVTPLGLTMAASWDGALAGRSPAGPIRRFDASGFPSRIAYEVSAAFALDTAPFRSAEVALLGRAATFGCQAALEAFAEARLERGPAADPERTAVCFGSGAGSLPFSWHERCFLPKAYEGAMVAEVVTSFPFIVSTVLARLANARGGAATVHTACAASGQALGEAFEMIAYDDADVVITGGADSMIEPFYIAGFSLLGALSKRNNAPAAASRPFDVRRDGFVLGEGAAVLVFEEYEHARRRGARIVGEVLGYGVTESAYRITDLHPSGRGPVEAMQAALAVAGREPEDIGYLNAHGTSTELNDRVEALAVEKVFGAHARAGLRTSSTKSMTGHLIAAAGALELAFCLKALNDQVLPPSVNLEEQDPACRIALTPTTATKAPLRYALSNSVGFGGSNTALVVGRIGHA